MLDGTGRRGCLGFVAVPAHSLERKADQLITELLHVARPKLVQKCSCGTPASVIENGVPMCGACWWRRIEANRA